LGRPSLVKTEGESAVKIKVRLFRDNMYALDGVQVETEPGIYAEPKFVECVRVDKYFSDFVYEVPAPVTVTPPRSVKIEDILAKAGAAAAESARRMTEFFSSVKR
jgi:hypothetical protein